MQLGLVCLCLLVMAGFALPLDPRVNPSKTEPEANKERARERRRPNIPDLPGVPEDLRRLRELRDLPGLDREEYRRYWDEIVKDNASKSLRSWRLPPSSPP